MLLSVCIPTFNRGNTIGRLLVSLDNEIRAGGFEHCVEIIISDNASEDETQVIVSQFIAAGLNITYFIQPANLGFGRNLTHAISLAKGEYCWMMGSDDFLVDGALVEILNKIATGTDVIVGNVVTNGNTRRLLGTSEYDAFLRSNSSIVDFLGRCEEISSLFAFMSSIVIRKKCWDDVAESDGLISHPYTHQLRIFTAIAADGLRVCNLQSPIVSTGDEGNEWDVSVARHFELDCRTINHIADSIFKGREEISQGFGTVFRRQYRLPRLIRARAGMDTTSWLTAEMVLRNWGYSKFLLKKRRYDEVILSLFYWAKKMERLYRWPLLR